MYHCAYLTDWEYKVLEDFFNTTAYFREDADIFVPFGRVVLKPEFLHMKKEGKWIKKMKPNINETYQKILRNKKRCSTWFKFSFTFKIIAGIFCL